MSGKKHKQTRIPDSYREPDKKPEFERKVINCNFRIDRRIFAKTPEERLRLKIAKSQIKDSTLHIKQTEGLK